MGRKKKTLKRSIFTGTVLFILLLCAVLSVVQLQQYRRILYSACESRMEDILRFLEGSIDVDDLAGYMRTGVESEKYRELQSLLDHCRERFNDRFIYIVEPLNMEGEDNIRMVIAGASTDEYENESDGLARLNSLTDGSCSPETAKLYLEAYESGEPAFFETVSELGHVYTGLLPLYDSRSNRTAALCVDVDAESIHALLRSMILKNIALAAIPGFVFAIGFLVWSGRKITRPIEQLERSVVDFASKCRDQRDPEALKTDIPAVKGNNEVSRLTDAFSEMSEAMQDYARSMASAEDAALAARTIAELQESINALFNNMPGMSFSKDAKTGVYLACNQAFAEYARRTSQEDVPGLTDAELFDPATARHFVETDRTALSMDEPYIYYEDVKDAGGSPRQLQTTKLKYTDPSGRLCLLGMCADVTDLRAQAQANSMITAMASDYRCVYYVNLDENDGVCYQDDPADPDQIPKGVHFPYLERITRYAENRVTEMYREGFLDFINPDNIRERLAEEPIIAYRYLAKRGDREYYEMIRVAGVRRAKERDDHMVHAVGLGFTTIDAEMRESMARNEALAQALAVAEEASKAKTNFLSNMSHEIRTPMNAIIGLDTLALHDDSLSPQTREYLEQIGDSAHHLLALINEILDMSRIESGRTVLRKEEFSFSAMLEQINTMVMSQCSDKGLHYECRLLSSIDDYYIGDDMKLKEVLINILSNAIKFTDAPGSVTLTIEKTAVFEGQSTLRFCIRDTGIGMDKDFIPKIFDTFSQADSSRKSKYGSTGLGMAITKNLVDMMNGTITVESEKGVGTEFTVVITLKNVEHQGPDRENAMDPGMLHVLIVDDEEIAAGHAKTVLDEAGIRSDICMSGEDALRMLEVQHLKQEPYNLVLLDWKMPEKDGVDTAREIRERYSNETTVIILTAYNWDEIVEEAEGAGVDSFLAKPLFASNVIAEFERIAYRNNMSLFREKKRAKLEGRRILLAEDIEINAEIMMDILEMEDVQTNHAENGRIVVEMFQNSEPGTYSAILMDVRMPEMDGLEAAEAIRALDRPDAKRIPIIALTANAFDEDVQRSLQAGMNAHLSKPVEPEHLYRTLEELIYEAENP